MEGGTSCSGEEGPKQNEKMLKLMECIDLALERIDDLEELAEKQDKRIWALEEEVEELKPKVCQCVRAEDKISAPDEVRV